jgi:hypothetical protein
MIKIICDNLQICGRKIGDTTKLNQNYDYAEIIALLSTKLFFTYTTFDFDTGFILSNLIVKREIIIFGIIFL